MIWSHTEDVMLGGHDHGYSTVAKILKIHECGKIFIESTGHSPGVESNTSLSSTIKYDRGHTTVTHSLELRVP